MKTQYLTNEQVKKIALVLPIKSCEKILEHLDELVAIKASDTIKIRKTQFIPAQDMFDVIDWKRK